MPFHYFHSERLGALFPVLYDAVHRERQTIPPQKSQAIIVGNLETEAWITRRFLEADGILMGVSFPFLESAIASFSQRLELERTPADSESWFLPPSGDWPQAIGTAEFELLTLGILNDRNNEGILHDLGYEREQLTPSQMTTLATALARELRETILHCPTVLNKLGQEMKPGKSAGEKLWQHLYRSLQATGRPFPAFEPGLGDKIAAKKPASGKIAETLYLIGMPILSEYHLRALAAIARHTTVHLYMTDLSAYAASDNSLLATAGKKAKAFVALLRKVCKDYSTDFTATAISASAAPDKMLSIYALPGIWRGAELIGDELHDLLSRNPNLYQNDIAVSLTQPGAQYAAFERALAMRQLIAFSRERFFEAPHPLAELWQILSDAIKAGISRPLLVRYALNPLVVEKYENETEKIQQWLAALEKAHGFRDDYPESQAVFGVEAALRRIARGVIIRSSQDTDLPAACSLRPFDNRDFAEGFHTFLRPLFTARERLANRAGDSLADAMLALQHDISGAGESSKTLAEWLNRVRTLRGFDTLTLPHIVHLLQRHLPAKSLAQQTGREGITFSSLAASCYTRDTQLLFDLNEDADGQDRQAEYLFPEIQHAQTHLTGFEQLVNQLATVMSSDSRYVILAYSSQDPATGAEKYPSQALAEVERAAEILGRSTVVSRSFSPDIIAGDASRPPVASDADRRTLWLLRNRSANPQPLSAYTLPKVSATVPMPAVELRDLAAYLANPARQVLRRHLPPEFAIAEFRRDEPKLAVGNDARLRFCEEYLELALLDASERTLPNASAFVRFRQARGDYPPEGFDHAMRLLAEGDNDRRLSELAQRLRDEFTLVEYVFRTGISQPFTVKETPRLARIYYPAPCLLKSRITGVSGILLQDAEGRLFRLKSAIYSDRNADLLELHLLLCLFALAEISLSKPAITLADFATNTRSRDAMGAIRFTARTGLPLPDFSSAKNYLEHLLTELMEQQIVWYDHSLIKDPKLAEWSEMPGDEVLKRLAKQQENNTNDELLRLQKYFALEVDSGSLRFFETFIRPVALLDRIENPEKTQGKNEGATKGKSTRQRANKL